MTLMTKLLRASQSWRLDFALAAGLVGLDVVARLTPHVPNFTPLAASALFAGMMLRSRSLALAVPILAMVLSDLVVGRDEWRTTMVIYAALVLPAALGLWARHFKIPVMAAALVPASSLIFFLSTNFAVWAFSGMYAPTMDGLLRCYVAALPFFQNTLAGDVFWSGVLFGGWWLARSALPAVKARSGQGPYVAAR